MDMKESGLDKLFFPGIQTQMQELTNARSGGRRLRPRFCETPTRFCSSLQLVLWKGCEYWSPTVVT